MLVSRAGGNVEKGIVDKRRSDVEKKERDGDREKGKKRRGKGAKDFCFQSVKKPIE